MANAAKSASTGAATGARTYNNNERRWMKPSKRAKGYAEERKLKVHKYGAKQGQELTDYDKGLRSGYLLCQSDHAGIFKYKQALAEGKSKSEASILSRLKKKFKAE